jgi:sialic acid synthase SpsE
MVEVIAEIANVHQGKPEKSLQLAEAAVLAGAASVKYQVYCTHIKFQWLKSDFTLI